MRLLVAIFLLLPVPGAAFIASNGMSARQISPTEIEVDHDARGNDTDYWCAAGDFVRKELRASDRTRIWRATPKPRKAGQGIVFTLDPQRKAEGAGLSQFGSGPRDGSLSAGMAVRHYCRLYVPRWRD